MKVILKQDITISSYLSGIILARTLHFMISSNIKIKNHFGFYNYIREDNNLYFLVDDASGNNNYTSSYYAANPMYNNSYDDDLSIISQSKLLSDYYNDDSTIIRIFDLLKEHNEHSFFINPKGLTKAMSICYEQGLTDGQNEVLEFLSLLRLLTIPLHLLELLGVSAATAAMSFNWLAVELLSQA
jgi:hypothetical protein